MSNHVVLLGCGDSGMPLLETLLSSGHDVLVIDDDPAVVQRLRDGDIPTIRGDGADRGVLHAAGADRARLVISTMRRAKDHLFALDHIRGIPLLARVFEPEDADAIRAHGGTPVLYSHATADNFLAWLDQAESVGIEKERRTQAR